MLNISPNTMLNLIQIFYTSEPTTDVRDSSHSAIVRTELFNQHPNDDDTKRKRSHDSPGQEDRKTRRGRSLSPDHSSLVTDSDPGAYGRK